MPLTLVEASIAGPDQERDHAVAIHAGNNPEDVAAVSKILSDVEGAYGRLYAKGAFALLPLSSVVDVGCLPEEVLAASLLDASGAEMMFSEYLSLQLAGSATLALAS